MYNINEKNNLDLDLAILSALLKGEMLFNTVIQGNARNAQRSHKTVTDPDFVGVGEGTLIQTLREGGSF